MELLVCQSGISFVLCNMERKCYDIFCFLHFYVLSYKEQKA